MIKGCQDNTNDEMGRYYEVDTLRGIAIIAMIIYHVLFCLYFFTDILPWFNPTTFSGAPIAATFVGIAGLSLVLAQKSPIKNIKRGLYILIFALIVSVVTWIFYPSGFVVFGVLHLIAFGTMIVIPFLSSKVKWYIPLIVGIVIIILGCFTSQMYVSTPLLVPLGIVFPGFYTIDYEPLIPWIGIMLIGVVVGKLLYPNGKRISALDKLGDMPKALKPLCFIGKHSLVIYLVHVPIIIIIFMLTGLASFW